MKKKIAIVLSASLLLLSVLTGCGNSTGGGKTSQGAASDVIKIGVMESLTGANAGGGELEKKGIELAHKLYPEVNGKKIELIVDDNKSDKVEAATVATRLVDNVKVSAIIGSYGSSLSMAAGSIVKAAKVPAVGPSPTNPLVTQGNEFYFRVCFIDPFQGKVMADYAYNKLGARKVAVIQEISNDYAVGLARFFQDEFKKLTGDPNSIITVSNYNTGDQDFSAQLTNIQSKKPDVIFAPGNFTESALLIKQARQLGIKTQFLGGDSWETPDFLSVGGKSVEGATFSTHFAPEKAVTAESTKFIDAYKKEYNEAPSAFSALGYDAYLIVYQAMQKAGSAEPVKIQQTLLATKDFQGATGVINFDENRNAIKGAYIKTVKDGKFQFLDYVAPSK